MDFDDTPQEAAFRRDAVRWLESRAPRRVSADEGFGSLFEDDGSDPDWVAGCRAWQRTKWEGGYAAITWPKRWGGRGGTLMEEIIFAEEEANFEVTSAAFRITLGMIAPTILVHGTDPQREHLQRIVSGEEIWCQLFSEPSAGSDLAGLRTRAVADGDEWVISGQKVWTSGAQYADWGYLIARSDPSVPKHAGLTAFLLPMDTPGVTVRPLRQMTGGADFNEVFFDDVRLPDANRLDAPGAGWRVALTTLMNERFSVGGSSILARNFSALVRLARAQGRIHDPRIRHRLADLHIGLEVMRFTNARSLTAISKGAVPGPEGSVTKLAWVHLLRLMADLGAELAGPEALLDNEVSDFLVGVPGARLAGGTDEVLRTIVGERVLGLPAEPRVDKDTPFAPTSSR